MTLEFCDLIAGNNCLWFLRVGTPALQGLRLAHSERFELPTLGIEIESIPACFNDLANQWCNRGVIYLVATGLSPLKVYCADRRLNRASGRHTVLRPGLQAFQGGRLASDLQGVLQRRLLA